jgi:protein-disulfide isomerase-like protein with CxxC motif
MAPAVEEVADRLAGEVRFDLLLGGVNVDSTLPVGAYGRRMLLALWKDVAATTGQRFGFRIPDGFVYNSVRPCLALAALRDASGRPPFGYLHRLQQLIFEQGIDVNDPGVLAGAAVEFGVDPGAVHSALDDPEALERLRAEFAGARVYGTHALPNVLVELAGTRRLLVGGYADATTLEELIRERLRSAE